jgi:2-aminoadipate transaminase
MRLNFSGVDIDGIVEGIRRIGKVVNEQIELYGTFTGAQPAAAAPRRPPDQMAEEQLADVLHLPHRARRRGAQGS